MAAQFQETNLSERHLTNLCIELENALYLAEFGQLNNPEDIGRKYEVDFEIRLKLIEELDEYHPSNFKTYFGTYTNTISVFR